MTENVEAFQFENPTWLYLLFVVPLLVMGYFLILQWKNKTLGKLAEGRLLKYLTQPVSTLKSFSKFFLFRNGIVFLILALANPQYGRGENKAVHEGIEILVALDVSNSMLALDLDPKIDRLTVAKMAIDQMLYSLHGDKVGIVLFAGDAFVRCPLTSDYNAVRMFTQSVSPDMMTNQGTSIGRALEVCMEEFDLENGVNKAIIVMSDGEDHEAMAEEQAKIAKENNIIVSTVGMGSKYEAPIPVYNRGTFQGFKKDAAGNTIMTQMNEKMLKDLKNIGGGVYVAAQGTYVDLKTVVEKVKTIEASEIESEVYTDYEDQYQWFLGLGLLLLFIEFFLSEKRSGILHNLQEYNE